MISPELIIYVAIGMMMLAMLLAMTRFVKGPSIVDRVVAFDSLTVTTLVIISIVAALSNRMIYFDVAIVYGLLSFIGVIVVAKYIQKGL
jgi:multicomponent Na+:H+ antiporter subunit F